MAEGYAVSKGGEIDIRTVSDTERAAIVNFLVLTPGYLITNTIPDETVRLWWDQYRSIFKDIECLAVTVEAASSVNGQGDNPDV